MRFSLSLDQMFGAPQYMWNMKWTKTVEDCKQNDIPLPKRTSIKQPSLLDDFTVHLTFFYFNLSHLVLEFRLPNNAMVRHEVRMIRLVLSGFT